MTIGDCGWRVMAVDEDEYVANLSATSFEVCDEKQDTVESIVRDLSIGSITESEAIKRIGALNG